MKRKVYLRADGNSQIGLGHVIRSCALADVLRDDFECHFYIQMPSPNLKSEIEDAGAFLHVLQDVPYEQEVLWFSELLTGKEIVVLDGYQFDSGYQKLIKQKGVKLVCIDDIHAFHFFADAVINHAGSVTPEDYSIEDYTKLYLGPSYLLLRKPFVFSSRDGIKHMGKDMLVCMGGADPGNDTIKVLSECLKSDAFEKISVVIGSGYKYKDELMDFIIPYQKRIEMHEQLNAVQMAALMRRSAIAVTPPSSIAFEYLSIGGILYLKQIADNQEGIRRYLMDEKIAFDFKEFPVYDSLRVDYALRHQKEVFDGKSNLRLKDIFQQLS